MTSIINFVVCLFIFAACQSTSSASWSGRRRLNMFSHRHGPIRDSRCTQFKTFTQLVDHFGFLNSDTYEQRYTLNTDFWEKGRPIFFYAGNEGLVYRLSK